LTDTGQHPDFAAISWEDLANAVAMCATAQWDPINHPAWKETLDRFVALNDAGPDGHGQAAPAAPADPPLQPGEYLHVQVKGYQEYEGWVTEGTYCGSPYVFVRDETGALIAKFPPDSVHCMTPPPVPLPVRTPRAALPAGQGDPWADDRDRYDNGEDDGEPADAFAGRVDPDAPF